MSKHEDLQCKTLAGIRVDAEKDRELGFIGRENNQRRGRAEALMKEEQEVATWKHTS